ncbi:hypothetical protein [Pseudomonas frederiksbergensis]|nr:hypothetical protein [Pseudomonas frederiksbergensis]
MMCDREYFKKFTNKAVIVDDGYRDVNLTMIDGSDFQEFFEHVTDAGHWEHMQRDVFSNYPGLQPEGLIEHEGAIRTAWDYFNSGSSSKYPCLEIMFRTLLIDVGASTAPLRPLVDYLENNLGLEVKRFSSVDAASDEIKSCRLVFLDFYLSAGTAEDMLQKIERHQALLSSKVDDGSPRFVYLMSTQLPGKPILERFRKITNIREALFSPVNKDLLKSDWIKSELALRADRYPDVVKVESFLMAFEGAVESSSKSLMKDIRDLELHDLSVLDSMRLYKEQETYAEYLGWLFSEALAAKIRNSSCLQGARSSVNNIKFTPFSGLLEPRSLLFKLYSEIAFSYPEEVPGVRAIHFGDVFYQKSHARSLKKSDLSNRAALKRNKVKKWTGVQCREDESSCVSVKQDTDQVFLVISPACDLIRCASDTYQVTCVRGKVEHSAPRLADLFDQKHVFGENKHLMRVEVGSDEKYEVINWTPKDIITISFGDLRNMRSYGKKARMNELFCHEIKEEALRVLGRVGVPVDPSFSIPLGAAFNFKMTDGSLVKLVAPSSQFVSAVRLAGNKINERKIIFTQEFKSWFVSAVRDHFGQRNMLKNVAAIAGFFDQSSNVEFNLEKKQEPALLNGMGKLIYLNQYSDDQLVVDLGLYVFPWEEAVQAVAS